MLCDVVVDLVYGDSGKGKITHSLLKQNKYTHVIRYNGGSNAGHSIYHERKKYSTHILPAGFFYGIKSIIGPGCVVNVEKFFKEMAEFSSEGFDVRNLIKIAKNAHIVTEEHVEEERGEKNIGTTRQGIGPCCRDKYARKGIRVENYETYELKWFEIDFIKEIYNDENNIILAEGAQGFGLDIDHGDYPYVTSSPCTVGAVVQNGISHKSIRNVYGVIKSYTTYVGSKKFQPEEEIFNLLQGYGQEYGVTTGRKRQCNWNDMSLIKKAILVNGVDILIVNKMDILQKVNVWKVYEEDGSLKEFNNEGEFKIYLENFFKFLGVREVIFSYNPLEI